MNSLVYDCMFSLVEARRMRKNCRWVGSSAGFRARSDLGHSLCNYTSLRGIYSSLREYNELRPYYTAKEPATNWINTIGLRPRESFTQWYQIQIESVVEGNGRLLRKHTNSPDEIKWRLWSRWWATNAGLRDAPAATVTSHLQRLYSAFRTKYTVCLQRQLHECIYTSGKQCITLQCWLLISFHSWQK